MPFVTVADCERPVPGQRGSPEGWDFDEVYRSRWPALVRLAFVTTQSLPVAEEVTQDAFLQLYRLRHSVRQPEAWLRQAVVSRVTSWVRRRRLERRHARDQVPQPAVPMAAVEFVALLSPLSPRQRAALFLRYHEDLSEQDIARVMGCRPGTVKSLINRALTRLREERHHG